MPRFINIFPAWKFIRERNYLQLHARARAPASVLFKFKFNPLGATLSYAVARPRAYAIVSVKRCVESIIRARRIYDNITRVARGLRVLHERRVRSVVRRLLCAGMSDMGVMLRGLFFFFFYGGLRLVGVISWTGGGGNRVHVYNTVLFSVRL